MEYLGLEGTRPYLGAAWYYGRFRPQVTDAFIHVLLDTLDLTSGSRVLDLGCGPGQIALRLAPRVAEVVGVDIEPDMVAEAERRAVEAGVKNARFLTLAAEELASAQAAIGLIGAATIGSAFHWMLDRDGILRAIDSMMTSGSRGVAFVTAAFRRDVPAVVRQAEETVTRLVARYTAGVPTGPHPRGRHDPFEEILARSAFSNVQRVEVSYDSVADLTPEALIGWQYSISHVWSRLGARRAEFEAAVTAELRAIQIPEQVPIVEVDEALVGLRL